MKLRILWWWVVLIGSGSGAGAAELSSAEMGQREREWIALEAMMSSQTQEGLFLLGDRDIRFWGVMTMTLIRERGLDYFRKYPADERRFSWVSRYQELQQMWGGLEFQSIEQLWENRIHPESKTGSQDREKMNSWANQWMLVRQETIASPAASSVLRCRLQVEELDESLRAYTVGAKPPEQYDWKTAGLAAATIAAAHPDSDQQNLVNLLALTLRCSTRYSPDRGAAVRAAFLESKNEAALTLARADSEIDALRHTPLQMTFTAIDGRQVDLAKLRGKVVLIDFWAATWCGACKVQRPLMKDLYAKYHDQGFEIIGVACELKESDLEYLKATCREEDLPWPQLFDSQGMNNPYARRFGFRGIPQYLLLDQDGLLFAHTHSSGGLRNLEAVLRKLMGLVPLKPGDENRVLGAKG